MLMMSATCCGMKQAWRKSRHDPTVDAQGDAKKSRGLARGLPLYLMLFLEAQNQ